MNQKVDIDSLLASSKLELKLDGKTYVMTDVPLPAFLSTARIEGSTDETLLHEQLALMLNVKREALSGVGIRAAALALAEIRKWILGEVGEKAAATGNP